MVIPRRAVLAAVVAAIVVGAITVAASILSAGGGGSALPDGAGVDATASLDPNVVFFGDALTARIDVAVDTKKVDPDRLRIATAFGPFDRLDQQKTRRDAGRISYITETYTLRCLSRACVQVLPPVAAAAGGAKPTQRRGTTFPPARVYVSGRTSVHPLLLEWPVVESVTRVNQTESQLENFFYKASLTPPPASYRVTPRALLWLLFAAFVVALAVPVGLVVRRVRAWRRARMPGGRPELPPLERALRLLEWANAQPAGEPRRRALELVATELRRSGQDDLVRAARDLAWSPPSPGPEDAGELGTRVRSATGGNGATPTT